MPIDHTEIIPGKAGFDLKMFTDPQRSFGMTDLTTDDLAKIARDIHSFLGIRIWLATADTMPGKKTEEYQHVMAMKCKHKKNLQGHCYRVPCANHVGVCPRHHSMDFDDSETCWRDKVTGVCPFSPYCTDKTGEHHTFLVYAATDGQAWAQAENEMVARGYEPHITRIEVVG